MKKMLLFACSSCFIIVNGQNVGIGTPTPAAPLHLKSTATSSTGIEMLRIESGSPYVSFYDNAGIYSGYIWYNQTNNRLEIGTPSGSGKPVVIAPNLSSSTYFTANGRIGLGNSSPTERLDVNGNININGLLKLNGNPGLAGQFLSSNGTGNPAWKNTSYSNDTRFSFDFNSGAAPLSGDIQFSRTKYNLNAETVIMNPAGVTINKTGLFHLEILVNVHILHGTTDNRYISCQLFSGSEAYSMLNQKIPLSEGSNELTERFSIDLHVTAGTVLRVYYSFNATSPGEFRTISGQFVGNLIAE
jgi:hypothetical protein